jgi:hypothetical protein
MVTAPDAKRFGQSDTNHIRRQADFLPARQAFTRRPDGDAEPSRRPQTAAESVTAGASFSCAPTTRRQDLSRSISILRPISGCSLKA